MIRAPIMRTVVWSHWHLFNFMLDISLVCIFFSRFSSISRSPAISSAFSLRRLSFFAYFGSNSSRPNGSFPGAGTFILRPSKRPSFGFFNCSERSFECFDPLSSSSYSDPSSPDFSEIVFYPLSGLSSLDPSFDREDALFLS